jgi:glycosyltransferase involved in cell wall biosynthesis
MYSQIDPKTVFVVIPAFNEYESLRMVIDELAVTNYNLVVVDDGSHTDVYQLLRNRQVFLLKHRINLGQGAALQTGIEFALSRQASYIVTYDADGQHKVTDIDKLLVALTETKSSIALGSRFITKNNSVPAKIVLQIGRYINFLFTGLFLSDAHNGLRAMTRTAAEKIQLKENRMAHATEILSQIKKHKLKYVEVPVDVTYTEYSKQKGQTTMGSFRILFDLFLNKIFK